MWWIFGTIAGLYLLRRADQAKAATPTRTPLIPLSTPTTMPVRPWWDRAETTRMLPPEAAPGVDSLGFFAPDAGYGGGDPQLTVPIVAAPGGAPGGSFDPAGGGGGGGGGGAGGGNRRVQL